VSFSHELALLNNCFAGVSDLVQAGFSGLVQIGRGQRQTCSRVKDQGGRAGFQLYRGIDEGFSVQRPTSPIAPRDRKAYFGLVSSQGFRSVSWPFQYRAIS